MIAFRKNRIFFFIGVNLYLIYNKDEFLRNLTLGVMWPYSTGVKRCQIQSLKGNQFSQIPGSNKEQRPSLFTNVEYIISRDIIDSRSESNTQMTSVVKGNPIKSVYLINIINVDIFRKSQSFCVILFVCWQMLLNQQ